MAIFSSLWRTDLVALAGLVVVLGRLYMRYRGSGVRTTKLPGPSPCRNILFGAFAQMSTSPNQSLLFDDWVKEYGTAFSLPMGLGYKDVVIADVKAAIHFLARDTLSYHQTPFAKVLIEMLFGPGILWAEEDNHRRQRKALTPAFSNAALRGYIPVFYDSVYKLKTTWESILESGETTIEVQNWMNNIALDNLGIAGFGYNFHCLDGDKPAVVDVFDAFESPEKSGYLSSAIFFLTPVFPALARLPTKASNTFRSTKTSMKPIAEGLIERMKNEMSLVEDKQTEKSIIGLLIKAETASSGLMLSGDEILAQVRWMNTLFFAGYETTSTTLTWALIELARNPEKQERLRSELAEFSGTDPTWEQLTLGLPYLNAVTQETLRCHPPVPEIARVAMQDDVIPLSSPVTTAAGEVITELIIAKGTVVHCPIGQINQSDELWGADAKEFKPERWVDRELLPGAKGIQGYHHIMSFSDGPRLCIGRNFALGNFKATLSVLVRNFSFELPGGVDTPIGIYKGILPRPRVESEEGPRVPLKIRRLD
ncbi:cytochrome P450 [Coprinopsis marcescibilis]|uniref:Cytochrome P450 n=1 Tax=Coprinopsis marcescibilis TaxID=230819 RepID=A0A5C3LJ70_COPMA|nr:cytochrome P450 [Coprinopsis marcescibilis]